MAVLDHRVGQVSTGSELTGHENQFGILLNVLAARDFLFSSNRVAWRLESQEQQYVEDDHL